LPHIQVAGSTYFVTFRLKDSLPKEALDKLAEESEQNKKLPPDEMDLAQRRWFGKFDDYLDRVMCGKAYLKNEQVADLVAEAIRYRDGNVYALEAFTIMHNHGHVVCTPLAKENGEFNSLTEIFHSLKRHTARKANDILGRSGAFWQDESYDRIVRDQAELKRIVNYVLNNPVKAGLVNHWKDWKWSYSRFEL
jgi:REP element-mobilizing transposase RayT